MTRDTKQAARGGRMRTIRYAFDRRDKLPKIRKVAPAWQPTA